MTDHPPRLALIQVFPIKSLDGVRVPSAKLLACGALEFDRQYAICDSAGQFLTGKRLPALHQIRSEYRLNEPSVTLRSHLGNVEPQTFELGASPHIAAWLSAALGQEVSLSENSTHGFPDDPEAPGPTLISRETLAELSRWFPGTSLPQMRARLRTNLEMEGMPAFWEDQLVPHPFQLGATRWRAARVCQRCVVPTRHPQTGTVTNDFASTFAQLRRETLPSSSPAQQFDHFYRVAINTIPAASNQAGFLRVGDELQFAAG